MEGKQKSYFDTTYEILSHAHSLSQVKSCDFMLEH